MDNDPESDIIHRELDTDAENPGVHVAEAVADLEDRDATNLSSMWDCVDGALDNIFSNPPAPEAQLEVTFSYETYRITVEQTGDAKFVKTE